MCANIILLLQGMEKSLRELEVVREEQALILSNQHTTLVPFPVESVTISMQIKILGIKTCIRVRYVV